MAKIKKILVANRGEIAIRVMRTCRDLGIKSVAVYSEADAHAPHVKYADESVFIGEAASSKSYLVMDHIISAAKATEADAIHPGYGFLSENADFSQRCEDEGIIFIGPKPHAIKVMGDKTAARELMKKADVPLPPGTTTALKNIEEAEKVAENIGYPVLIKAAAGGGGKGMRIVYEKEKFASSIKAARSEALNAFGDDRVYVEKYLESPHHVEFQIIADSHGNVRHLFDRECSIQRRHQKVVEEAPCAFITEELRHEMAKAACEAARSCNYLGAGTIEFLVDKHRNFFFLEMNTRLQVEHPVTELITGFDLVELQIMVAEGKALPFKQEEVQRKGHAIECRICAEDPANQFLPSTGKLTRHRIPSGPSVRVDSGVEEGQEISINYDPLMTKLCVHGRTREEAIRRMKRALKEYEISGCKTTIPFCHFVMEHDSFNKAVYDTHFVKDYFHPEQMEMNIEKTEIENIAPVVASLLSHAKYGAQKVHHSNGQARVGADPVDTWWIKRKY